MPTRMRGPAMADNDNVQADPRDTDPRDFTAIYNTPLTPPEEDSFQGWMKDQSDKSGRDVSKDLSDYDLRGYWRANAGDTEEGPQLAGGPPETRAHLTDDYKKPNHMTFSTGSIWHGLAGNEGGTWEKRDDGSYLFTPGKNNRGFYSSDDMNRYFDKVERTHGNDIRLPGTEAPAPPPAPPGIQM